MSYRSMQLGRLHLMRWGTPTLDDTNRLVLEVQRAHKSLKQPLIGVAIVPADAEPPRDDVRSAMVKRLDDLLQCCERMYFVMEGSGFRQSVMRSVLAGLLLAAGKRGRITVHSDVVTTLALVAPQIGYTIEEIVAHSRAQGLLSNEGVSAAG